MTGEEGRNARAKTHQRGPPRHGSWDWGTDWGSRYSSGSNCTKIWRATVFCLGLHDSQSRPLLTRQCRLVRGRCQVPLGSRADVPRRPPETFDGTVPHLRYSLPPLRLGVLINHANLLCHPLVLAEVIKLIFSHPPLPSLERSHRCVRLQRRCKGSWPNQKDKKWEHSIETSIASKWAIVWTGQKVKTARRGSMTMRRGCYPSDRTTLMPRRLWFNPPSSTVGQSKGDWLLWSDGTTWSPSLLLLLGCI